MSNVQKADAFPTFYKDTADEELLARFSGSLAKVTGGEVHTEGSMIEFLERSAKKPTLGALRKEHGEDLLRVVRITLALMADMYRVGPERSITDGQIRVAARQLVDKYPTWKIDDVIRFAQEVPSGTYGKAFGRFDLPMIFEFAALYDKDREDAFYDRHVAAKYSEPEAARIIREQATGDGRGFEGLVELRNKLQRQRVAEMLKNRGATPVDLTEADRAFRALTRARDKFRTRNTGTLDAACVAQIRPKLRRVKVHRKGKEYRPETFEEYWMRINEEEYVVATKTMMKWEIQNQAEKR